AEAHRNGRELPELGHESGVGVRREPALGWRLAPEVVQLLLVEPALEVCPGVDPGRGVALVEDLVTRLAALAGTAVAAAEEPVEADLVERRGRGVRREVAADSGEPGVRPEDHGDR